MPSKPSTFSMLFAAREKELGEIDSRLTLQPDSSDLILAKASLLTELGRVEEAKATYLKAVSLAPTHFAALNNFGKLLFDNGYLSAARTAFEQAIRHHPDNPIAYSNLGHVFYKLQDLTLARQCYEKALELDPSQIEAHRGLSYVLRETGDEEAARAHRRVAFADRRVMTLPYRGKGEPFPILQLISAAGGNIPWERFLDDRVFLNSIVVTEYFDPSIPLPRHSLVVNAIADADLCGEALLATETVLTQTRASVINRPSSVLLTSRALAASRLGSVPDVVAPRTVSLSREVLTRDDAAERLAGHGFTFPLLLRSPGFHTGQFFAQVKSPDSLATVLSTLPGEHVLVIQFLDARGEDGKIRKYRVMMIDGVIYPLHLAVSHDWKVHYFSADMAHNPENRLEDAAFLDNMAQVLGDRAMKALEGIQEMLGLDYAGVDFGLNQKGEILLFEANAAINVLPPGPDDLWNYRRPHVQRVIEAVRRMMIERGSGRSPSPGE